MSARTPEARMSWMNTMVQRALVASALLAIAVVAEGVVLYKLAAAKPESRYVSLTTDNRIIPLTPTSSPIPDSAVLKWVGETLLDINTLTYIDAQRRVPTFRSKFTERGWQAWIDANRDNLNTVVTRQYIVSAAFKDPPAIVDRGVVSGVAYWKVRGALLVKYDRAGQSAITQTQSAELIVARQLEDVESSGLGISSLITRQGGGM